jgi:hypothetical protein
MRDPRLLIFFVALVALSTKEKEDRYMRYKQRNLEDNELDICLNKEEVNEFHLTEIEERTLQYKQLVNVRDERVKMWKQGREARRKVRMTSSVTSVDVFSLCDLFQGLSSLVKPVDTGKVSITELTKSTPVKKPDVSTSKPSLKSKSAKSGESRFKIGKI